jgi:hypothetical protein
MHSTAATKQKTLSQKVAKDKAQLSRNPYGK